ncbi:MAG: OmpA family protein [Sphingobium sp.]|jgi:flagellar motor protein MotB|nr:OmpA family protein [Sphingobium sp.]MCP5400715.1 OmpA family protein [Sphingomonas sp.]
MKARAVALARRNRWALSFADLCLLLLGFFILLHASNGRQQEVMSGVAQEFGAPVVKNERLVAKALFQPGEAMLSAAGKAEVAKLAQRYRGNGNAIEIRSVGLDQATNRFDNWDLAAARLGALARALKAEGVPRDRVVIRGLDQLSESKAGQVFVIRSM